jgi:hypothetical protein
MVSGLFEEKRDAILPHLAPPQVLHIIAVIIRSCIILIIVIANTGAA